jgi:deferrochelatase/peroxidase EfeB
MNSAIRLDLGDIQANILRGYRATDVCQIAVAFGAGPEARSFVGALISGEPDVPQISTAEAWDTQPPYCLTIGFTAEGLDALGLMAATRAQFPPAFRHGSARRSSDAAARDPLRIGLGDVDESAPEHWRLGGPHTPTPHALLTVSTDDTQAPGQAALLAALRRLFADHQVTEIAAYSGQNFPGGVVHFGYRDHISQPTIDGGPPPEFPDMQPVTPTGDVLLGRQYVNTYHGTFTGALPQELAGNATYCAFRILEQDVRAFEHMLTAAARRSQMDPELVAAKLVGRWRNGVPLTISPTTATPPRWNDEELNRFDYAPSDDHPMLADDDLGMGCPMGSHIRRMNPRSGLAMGVPHNRRIVRRGVPYGPMFDPAVADDGIERGQLAVFICGDLEMHFEFIQRVWINGDLHMSGLRGTRDPIAGYQFPELGGRFVIRTNDTRDPVAIVDLPRLVTTRGSLYTFMPGIGGLRYLATLPPTASIVGDQA